MRCLALVAVVAAFAGCTSPTKLSIANFQSGGYVPPVRGVTPSASVVSVTADEAVIRIISPGGVGSADLMLEQGTWPRQLVFEFLYAEGKPFGMLESFAGWPVDPATGKTRGDQPLPRDPRSAIYEVKEPKIVRMQPPADPTVRRIKLLWIDHLER